MEYKVQYVDGDIIPNQRGWAICVDDETAETTLYLSKQMSQFTFEERARMLEDCWRGFIALQEATSMPQQRGCSTQHVPRAITA